MGRLHIVFKQASQSIAGSSQGLSGYTGERDCGAETCAVSQPESPKWRTSEGAGGLWSGVWDCRGMSLRFTFASS
jgi:hypothetical protein